MLKNKTKPARPRQEWLSRVSVAWFILCLTTIAFFSIHYILIDSTYASDLANSVWNDFHTKSKSGIVTITKDAISIAYQLGRLDFATFALTGITVVIAIAGVASYVGIRATALTTTENKILELLDDEEFEEKIRLKMGDDIHLKVIEVVKKHMDMRENIENQEVGNEFNDYFEKIEKE